MSNIPRRNNMLKWTPAESAIASAIGVVESMPAHPHLTDAVVLLTKARDKVADFVDQVPIPADDLRAAIGKQIDVVAKITEAFATDRIEIKEADADVLARAMAQREPPRIVPGMKEFIDWRSGGPSGAIMGGLSREAEADIKAIEDNAASAIHETRHMALGAQSKPAPMRQVFGFTPPGPLPGENYVKFIMVFAVDDQVIVQVRATSGEITQITLPVAEAQNMAKAIGSVAP